MSGEVRLTEAEIEMRCRREQISHEHYTRADVQRILAARVASAAAEAWDRGYTAGHSNAMRRMSDEPRAPTSANPYRACDGRELIASKNGRVAIDMESYGISPAEDEEIQRLTQDPTKER